MVPPTQHKTRMFDPLQTGFLFNFPFDPMGMRSKETELKELKNGRLVGSGCRGAEE